VPIPDVTKLIERAIRERRVLRVTYRAEDGTVHDHVVEPLAIRFNSAKHRVLWCWNQDVGHIEELIWDGIENAVETGETFAPRPWDEAIEGQAP
jgi:predicted DNA-binding transcriptional regulator YafY